MFVAIAEIPTQLATIPNWPAFLYNGSGFGHIALELDDVYKATEAIRKRGGKILREAGPMNAGTTIIAFVTEPDNYQIKIIGKMQLPFYINGSNPANLLGSYLSTCIKKVFLLDNTNSSTSIHNGSGVKRPCVLVQYCHGSILPHNK